jgi:uncharacterized protein (TIGR00730 family)
MSMKSLCVFCGANPGTNPAFVEAAKHLGGLLADKNIRLVYGGGKVGMMGAVADGCIARQGKVTGIIPKFLVDKEVAHNRLNELLIVTSMHERKKRMADLSEGFVTLPGGMGTLEELFEVTTWGQLGLHEKPIGLLNIQDYFTPLLQFLDHGVTEKFIKPEHRGLILTDTEPAGLLQKMLDYRSPRLERWLRKTGEA